MLSMLGILSACDFFFYAIWCLSLYICTFPEKKCNIILMNLACLCFLYASVFFEFYSVGNSSCHSNGSGTWYLGDCFVQKIERLVALGNLMI